MKIELTKFVERQWDPKFAGTKMDIPQEDFIKQMNESYTADILKSSQNDFCKYLYYDNNNYIQGYRGVAKQKIFPTIKKSVIKIDHTIYPYIQSSYSSRTPEELPVLSRWVSFPPSAYSKETAEYIGLVLYSREQLLKEHNAMFPPENYQSDALWADKNILGQPKFELSEDCEYGIVAIMGLGQPEMDPMPPITHLRNALGTSEGGNGVTINREQYDKSVKFWTENILIK